VFLKKTLSFFYLFPLSLRITSFFFPLYFADSLILCKDASSSVLVSKLFHPNELTDEWKERGVKDKDYGLLTDDITKTWSGKTTGEYKEFKQNQAR